MSFKTIQEGKAKIHIPVEVDEKISKKLPVFYNPVMKFNRDTSILLLNALPDTAMQIADPLAGTGIRAIRFLLELKKGKVENLTVNDMNSDFENYISSNLELSEIDSTKFKINIVNSDANLFLLNSSGFDYIDIDPFGPPNKFLDSAISRLSREGILAVTATDTSALCGSFPKVCKRKYWATPKKGSLMHETGLRILIRKVQLIGGQYERALTPLFSYSRDHYMRVFFRCKKSKTEVDKIIKQHGLLEEGNHLTGPMWLGTLGDATLAVKILDGAKKMMLEKESLDSLRLISEELKIDTVGLYDIHALCKRLKLKQAPKMDLIVTGIEKKGFSVSRTHFNKYGLRSDIPEEQILTILKAF